MSDATEDTLPEDAPVDEVPADGTPGETALDVAAEPPAEPELTLEEAFDVLEDEIGQLKMRGGDSVALQDALRAIRKAHGGEPDGGPMFVGTPLGPQHDSDVTGAPKLPVVPVEPEALSETVYRVDKPPVAPAPAAQDQAPARAATPDDEARIASLDAGATPMTETK